MTNKEMIEKVEELKSDLHKKGRFINEKTYCKWMKLVIQILAALQEQPKASEFTKELRKLADSIVTRGPSGQTPLTITTKPFPIDAVVIVDKLREAATELDSQQAELKEVRDFADVGRHFMEWYESAIPENYHPADSPVEYCMELQAELAVANERIEGLEKDEKRLNWLDLQGKRNR